MSKLWKAAFWRDGIDEVTFVTKAAPLVREELTLQVEVSQILAGVTAMASSDVVEQIGKDEVQNIIAKIVAATQKKAVEYVPEICRQAFRLIDLDNSGEITTRELTVLKALLDGFLRLGTLAIVDKEIMDAEQKAILLEMYPDLFVLESEDAEVVRPTMEMEAKALLMALFDAIDRDGDGQMLEEEMVGFIMKCISFWLQMSKIYTGIMIEAFIELEKDMLKVLWQNMGISEVSRQDVPKLVFMVPMLMMSPLAQVANSP